ncbi:hypothetical protein DPEC_G00322060 [Dallia pectoralis]|uniref:Uncharacterized protein n=1 Tax=Dallia pectoralis TaxID=75939 RepID=A0ACC2FAI5_DALPE|nr:hypothetical protein DPEC_G00322060 [Dallia pectoralis]
MKTATWILLFVTVGVGLAHSPGGRSEKCLCKGKPLQFVRMILIKEIKQYSKSGFCGKIEVIAIMKNGEKKCLDPEGKLLKRYQRYQRKKVGQQTKMPKKGKGRRKQ